MLLVTKAELKQIAQEINGENERDRRSLALRRQDMYRDAGKRFMIERLVSEFGLDGIKEMRLAPINFLKKIVNRISQVYREPPQRKAVAGGNDQKLVDFYTKKLKLDRHMQQCNRYTTLQANNQLYVTIPPDKADPTKVNLELSVVPPYLYSLTPSLIRLEVPKAVTFSRMTEEGDAAPRQDIPRPGQEAFSRERGTKEDVNLVDSNEEDLFPGSASGRVLIYWDDHQHYTLDNRGNILGADPTKGDEQFVNPIGRIPSTTVARERDNESIWAKQGEDLVDGCLEIQLGLSDILTVQKTQGFSLMTIVSASEPSKLIIGIHKIIWLQPTEDVPNPTVSYVQATSPVRQNMENLKDLLRLLLLTNDVNPGTISGDSAQAAQSGLSQIIQMSDTIERVESDKPLMRDAETDAWDIISKYHNWAHEMKILTLDAMAMGKFSDKFQIEIIYAAAKPLDDEMQVLSRIKQKKDLGLQTRKGALKELHPTMDAKGIDTLIKEIDEEKEANVAKMQAAFGPSTPKEGDDGDKQSDPKDDRPVSDSGGQQTNPFEKQAIGDS